MSVRPLSLSLISLALTAFGATVWAQNWSPEQEDIWRLEKHQWKMAAEKDTSWIEKMAHPNISYWDTDAPGPQNKSSLLRWNRYYTETYTVIEHEIFPISVTITGDVAVAHYHYSIAHENYRKEREIVTGRYTDVLVREDGRWLFLAWAGGDNPKKQ